MALTAQSEIGITADSLVSETGDTLATADCGQPEGMLLIRGIALERPEEVAPVPAGVENTTSSWVLSALILVFLVAALRYRKNTRYIAMLIKDVVEVKERHNAFDDTVRETSFIWLLNLLWCLSAGVLLYGWVELRGEEDGFNMLQRLHLGQLAVCAGSAAAYTLFMATAYYVVGSVFSDSNKASFWTKGFLSVQGLTAIIMFPFAMLALCSPDLLTTMLLTAVIIFFISKILFIYKGFCIFFTEIASWVLFLYYLCSLEIVPIVLTYATAIFLCEMA